MNRLERLVADLFAAFDVDAAMADIGALIDFDRLQASHGIEQAAERVAERAAQAGCDDVEIVRFPADGQTHWWTFRAPRSYTPLRAALELTANGSQRLAAYPDVACSLAAYSAATDATAPLVRYGSAADMRGAIAVIAEAASLPLAIEHAERAGAVGVVSDLASRHLPGGETGRIELPVDTRLFGFSISSATMASALEAADADGLAHATVVLADTDACMPVVTATIGDGATDEVWLQAHLCHRSPGANDNLSGTAALLGIARAARVTLMPPAGRVRFVWMPEFVGTAAFLHRAAGEGKLPIASIDLDMVGEDQRLCGGPLIVERSPDHQPHFLNAVVEHALDALPDNARSYSGAVGVRNWTWRATPFVGASDHALFADRSIGVPAVQLGHWPDRFNHSSADTIDKVDGEELRRAATVAGASASFVASIARHDESSLEDIVFRWGLRRIAEAASPDALAHAREVATASLVAASTSARSERLRGRLRDHAEAFAELVGTEVEPASGEGPPLRRRWPGPFNLRAAVDASDKRTWLLDRMAQDRATFPAATALALAIDDRSGRDAVIARATVSSGLTIDADFADRFLTCLIEAGWVEEAAGCR